MTTQTTLTALTPLVDRALTLDEWSREGWGHSDTLRRRIKDGRLPAEQIDRRGTYVVRESDLMQQSDLVKLRRSRGYAMPSDRAVPGSGLDDLAALAERLVSTWPALDAARKRELGRLLAAS